MSRGMFLSVHGSMLLAYFSAAARLFFLRLLQSTVQWNALGHPTSPTLDIDRYGKDKWGNGTAKEWKDKGAQRLKGSWKEGKGPSHCE